LKNIHPIIENVIAQADGAAAPSAGGGEAQTGTAPAGGEGGAPAKSPGLFGGEGGFNGLIMIVLMFAVFYLLLIRPQQKKAKEHQKMLDAIGKGAEIVTNGGLIGRVVLVKDNVLTVELADKVRVRVLRSQVSGLYENFVKSDKGSENKSEKK
jgi:preprotein translocase subunit YajC